MADSAVTLAPANLKAAVGVWTAHGGVNLGIVGDAAHLAKGTSYHVGKDYLRPDAYSVRTLRDRQGLSIYASAIDLGRVNGGLAGLRKFSVWLVEQCRHNASDTRDIREVIYSPDGQTVLRWDRERGIASQPMPGEADSSHRTHTHISYYRDSRGRSQTGPFTRYFSPVQPPRLHIAKGATVRVYTLGTKVIDGQLCIKGWFDSDPWPSASRAEIYQPPGEMHRVTCDGKSGAYTVRVRTGVYAGRWVQTRANGVTVS